jgi:hypothetical protein
MTVIQKAFGMYRIDYLSRAQETLGVRHSITEVSVRVSPHNQDQVGIIMFRDEFPPRTNFINSNDIINILRYGKALYIYIETDNWGGGILTDPEGIGEEEL